MTRAFAVLLLLAGVVVDGFRLPMTMSSSKTNKKTPPASEPQKPPRAPRVVRMHPALDTEGGSSSSSAHQAATLDASSLESISAKCSSDSPFHCVIEDELGRPRSEARPQGDGRSWHASLPLPSAQQILADASRLRSVSKDLLQDALHYLEWKSLFGKGNKDKKEVAVEEEAAATNELLDGTWRLAFNSGGAFPFLGMRADRWGYLKDEVEVRIDTAGSVATILVDAFAKRFEGTLVPVPGARHNTLALDFSRVQLLKGTSTTPKQQPSTTPTPMLAPGELKLVNAILRPGARLHLISVAASYLALRFTPSSAEEGAGDGDAEACSSLLVFSRAAAKPAKPNKAKAAAVAAPAPASTPATAPAAAAAKAAPAAPRRAAAASSKEGGKAAGMKPRFKKPLKGTPSNPYASFFEYLEEECVPLYLALSFPTFAKHLPHIAHAARFKLMLLQELWVEVARHWPFHH